MFAFLLFKMHQNAFERDNCFTKADGWGFCWSWRECHDKVLNGFLLNWFSIFRFVVTTLEVIRKMTILIFNFWPRLPCRAGLHLIVVWSWYNVNNKVYQQPLTSSPKKFQLQCLFIPLIRSIFPLSWFAPKCWPSPFHKSCLSQLHCTQSVITIFLRTIFSDSTNKRFCVCFCYFINHLIMFFWLSQ